MPTNLSNNFKEASLDPDFASDALKEFKQLIDSGISFVVHSMPGTGASYFLKYLTSKSKVLQASSKISHTASEAGPYFVHIDLYNLPTLNQHEFYRMFLRDLDGDPSDKTDEQVFLDAKEILKKLTAQHEKVVIIFSRFDQLKNDLDENFLSNLQSLTTLAPHKIVLIFTSIKALHELAPQAVSGGNLTFYSRSIYFKPYSKKDLRKLLTIDPEQRTSDENFERLLELSGGHNQLLHILLNSQKQQNLLLDQFVRLQLKELIDYLDYVQRKQIIKIALNKKIDEVDEYLLGIGMVKKDSHYHLFTPLLAEYVKTSMPVKLPVKEAKLFKLLKQKIGQIVTKDEIFAEVWGEGQQNATDKFDLPSDWALDALIYRLRKHPLMQANGYIIESHKKVGYTLIQG
ncbi:MAG: helix-turn-helix domain-containing protein [Candidatus Daviesbacteria bacterium]|nr:helix-turn-helix domain-containing protein [Candidatus Daviesbacteria bacterium]